jgi:hypothetical protein
MSNLIGGIYNTVKNIFVTVGICDEHNTKEEKIKNKIQFWTQKLQKIRLDIVDYKQVLKDKSQYREIINNKKDNLELNLHVNKNMRIYTIIKREEIECQIKIEYYKHELDQLYINSNDDDEFNAMSANVINSSNDEEKSDSGDDSNDEQFLNPKSINQTQKKKRKKEKKK